MKIELGKWSLSLFENEYQEVHINETSIKVTTIEGKTKLITFNLSQKEGNEENKAPPKRINEEEGNEGDLKQCLTSEKNNDRNEEANNIDKDMKDLKDTIEDFNSKLINEKIKLENLNGQLTQINTDNFKGADIYENNLKTDDTITKRNDNFRDSGFKSRSKHKKEFIYTSGQKVEVLSMGELMEDLYGHRSTKKTKYKEKYQRY